MVIFALCIGILNSYFTTQILIFTTYNNGKPLFFKLYMLHELKGSSSYFQDLKIFIFTTIFQFCVSEFYMNVWRRMKWRRWRNEKKKKSIVILVPGHIINHLSNYCLLSMPRVIKKMPNQLFCKVNSQF
jgi:hypothetical protein